MKTKRLTVTLEQSSNSHPAIVEAAEILRRGGLVAIPTETVYGLAANALDAEAVRKIFAAKERPAWDPLIVHIAETEMRGLIAEMPMGEVAARILVLTERFWPGPLTLILPKSARVPPEVTAGGPTVAVRRPAHPVAAAVIRVAGIPLAAPSANRFGHTSPTTAEHVLADLDGRIDAVLDAGPTRIGVESTVLDPTRTPPLILRPGGVTREQIEEAIGPVDVFSGQTKEDMAMASPGLTSRHYAPQAKLVLCEGSKSGLAASVREAVAGAREQGSYVGVLAPTGWISDEQLASGGVVLYDWGHWTDWSELAHNLFAGIRYLDKPGVSVILCPLPPADGMALALRDRLSKAARQ